jgi:hypothetical protein
LNNSSKERAAETAAAAALVALLSTAIALGAMIQDRAESGKIVGAVERMAERLLVPSGTEVTVRPLSKRPSAPVRRAYTVYTRDGRTAGVGVTVAVEGSAWNAELLVLMDERGRIVSAAPRDGSSGIRAEELAIFLRQREKKAKGGLGAAADPGELEFSVNRALAAAVRLPSSSLEGGK